MFGRGKKIRTFAIPNGGTVDIKEGVRVFGKERQKIIFVFSKNLLTFADPNGKAVKGSKIKKK